MVTLFEKNRFVIAYATIATPRNIPTAMPAFATILFIKSFLLLHTCCGVLFFFLLFFHLHTSTLLFFPPLCLGDITGFTSKLSRTNLATAHISGKIKLNRFSTQDCGSILEYPRSHLHLSDSLTHSSFRRKFQITGTDLEPKTLVNSRLFLGCPYYTAITLFPSSAPCEIAGLPYNLSPASLQHK